MCSLVLSVFTQTFQPERRRAVTLVIISAARAFRSVVFFDFIQAILLSAKCTFDGVKTIKIYVPIFASMKDRKTVRKYIIKAVWSDDCGIHFFWHFFATSNLKWRQNVWLYCVPFSSHLFLLSGIKTKNVCDKLLYLHTFVCFLVAETPIKKSPCVAEARLERTTSRLWAWRATNCSTPRYCSCLRVQR